MQKKQFNETVYKDLSAFIYGKAEYPVPLANGMVIGGGTEEKYYLLENSKIVQYGGNFYRVSFHNRQPHKGQPYLLIKGSQKARSTSTSRNARGLKL